MKARLGIILMVLAVSVTVGLAGTGVVRAEEIGGAEAILRNYNFGGWNGWNSLRWLIRLAADRGVETNTIVMLLMLPLIATLASVVHYVVGLSGYGIFMPTTIAIAFLATGMLGGLVLFAVILAISIGSNLFLKKLRLHFWPARAIGLMMISLTVFGLMAATANLEIGGIEKISIFPVLFMIMLAEEFVRTQLTKSRSEAKKLTLGTLVLAMSGAVVMNIEKVQQWVLLYPELMVVVVVVVNLIVGNYTGIRLSEIKRFRKAIRTSLKKS